MFTGIDIKYWTRSGSVRFMRDRKAAPGGPWGKVTWRGHTVHYRPGTSDLTLIYRVLLKPEAKREYRLPDLEPRVILDIGANIGVTSLLMAERYPNARILAFEPAPENVALLRANTRAIPRIEVYPFALGAQDGELRLRASDDPGNHGGFSFFASGTRDTDSVTVPVRAITGFLREQAIDRVDFIKIDTEGSEYPILMAVDPEVLARVKWITGELHGNRDFALLDHLSQWFDISMRKDLRSRLSIFEAAPRVDSR